MTNVNELLNDPEIAEFLRTHRGVADELGHAAQLLAGEPDAAMAMRKVLPALDERVVRVFFSYKKKDERAARAIVNLLRENSAEKLQITFMADFAKQITGREWRETIRNAICRANWFMLLLPDPSDDWDWCLWETALFEVHRTSADRLICLHHPDTKIPGPIDDYEAIPAIIPSVEGFLNMVYVLENPVPGMKPINKSIEPKIPKLAKEIVEAIRAPRRYRQILMPWIELQIDRPTELRDQDHLDRAVLVSCNQEALTLFDFFQKPETWGELRSGVAELKGDGRWRRELAEAIKRIARGRRFSPVQAVFQTQTGKIYRPVACAIDRLGDEERSIGIFHITFIEDVGALDLSSMPANVATLASVLRFGFRFRWEVLEKFSKAGMTEADLERLESTLRRIRLDWQSRGIADQPAIERLFPQEKAKRISEIFVAWRAISNQEGTGELDIAIRNKDTQSTPAILVRSFPMSQEFLEMVADRFSELVSSKA